jgi:hypothetical protein
MRPQDALQYIELALEDEVGAVTQPLAQSIAALPTRQLPDT